MKATKFQQDVWKLISKIPKGKVTTYKELARALNTKAYRAVGSAVGKNPYAPIVPCHRVINSSGLIGNYSADGGVKKKIELLQSEGVKIKDNKIDLKKYIYYFDK